MKRSMKLYETRAERNQGLLVWAVWFGLSFICAGQNAHWTSRMWVPLLFAGVILPWLFLGLVWLHVRRQESLRRRKTGLS